MDGSIFFFLHYLFLFLYLSLAARLILILLRSRHSSYLIVFMQSTYCMMQSQQTHEHMYAHGPIEIHKRTSPHAHREGERKRYNLSERASERAQRNVRNRQLSYSSAFEFLFILLSFALCVIFFSLYRQNDVECFATTDADTVDDAVVILYSVFYIHISCSFNKCNPEKCSVYNC